MYDLGIIGGGPAGYTAAERAAVNGLRVVIFEKADFGGVCLNEGCIPTKTILYSAKLISNARGASKYGVSAENVSFDYGKIIARKNKVVRKMNAGVRARMNHENIKMVVGEASVISTSDEGIGLQCSGEAFRVRNLLICTGSHNFFPPIPGIVPDTVWTSREALTSKELPASIAIIGGGVIGMEFAGFFNTLGVEVTVVEMLDEILGNMDKEISALLREEYTKKGIRFQLQSKVLELRGNELIFEKDGEKMSVNAERVLLSVGRKSNMDGAGLENLPIETFRGGVVVNEYMQTSVPHIYAAGDVTGFSLLAHTAVREAEVAVNHMLGISDAMSYAAIPGVVYTNPEVAGVGETEESLITKKKPYHVAKLSMNFSGRFVAENEGGNGLCKILSDEKGKVLGVHLIGNPASEIITVATLAMELDLTVAQWQKSVFPHPTVGEILKETLFE